MNKTELILGVAEETGFSRKNVEIGLNAAINLITKALADQEKVQIVGFGAFETKVRAERMGRNPKTGEDIPIPATKVPAKAPVVLTRLGLSVEIIRIILSERSNSYVFQLFGRRCRRGHRGHGPLRRGPHPGLAAGGVPPAHAAH